MLSGSPAHRIAAVEAASVTDGPDQGQDRLRPRVRGFDGHELPLPTWTAAQAENWLGHWAMNLMLINVSTRKFRRAVRLPEGDLLATVGDGTSKSAASRRFVALSAERLAEWMASDLSKLDLLVIQIDGLHIDRSGPFRKHVYLPTIIPSIIQVRRGLSSVDPTAFNIVTLPVQWLGIEKEIISGTVASHVTLSTRNPKRKLIRIFARS